MLLLLAGLFGLSVGAFRGEMSPAIRRWLPLVGALFIVGLVVVAIKVVPTNGFRHRVYLWRRRFACSRLIR